MALSGIAFTVTSCFRAPSLPDMFAVLLEQTHTTRGPCPHDGRSTSAGPMTQFASELRRPQLEERHATETSSRMQPYGTPFCTLIDGATRCRGGNWPIFRPMGPAFEECSMTSQGQCMTSKDM